MLVSDLEVRTGVGIGQVRPAVVGLDADLDAAELLGKLVEAVKVKLGEVVDLLPGQRLDRIDRGLPASLPSKLDSQDGMLGVVCASWDILAAMAYP